MADLVESIVRHIVDKIAEKGGAGSGNFGHAGRPGEVGGSAPKDGIRTGVGDGGDNSGKFPVNNARAREVWNKLPENVRNTIKGVTGFDVDADIIHQAGRAHDQLAKWNTMLSVEKIYEIDEKGEYVQSNYDYVELKIDPQSAKEISEILEQRYAQRKEYIRKELGFPDTPEEFFGVTLDELKSRNIKDSDYDRENYERVNAETMKRIAGKDLSGFSKEELDDIIYDYSNEYKSRLGLTINYNDGGIKPYDLPDDDPRRAAYIFTASMITHAQYRLEKKNEFDVWEKCSSGKMDIETANRLAHGEFSSREWKPLPDALYHAAPDVDSILDDQIKSRYELKMEDTVGLGGGSDMTISFTTGEDVARGIERSLHEAHAVMTGRIPASKLIEIAKTGAGADRPFFDSMPQEAKYAAGVLLDLEAGKDRTDYRGEKHRYWDTLWSFYNYFFMNGREAAGGSFNPLFFGTNWRKLIEIDPAKFKVIRYKPVQGGMGMQLSGLSEWRVVGGNSVIVDEVIDFFDENSDIDEILGLI